MKTTLLLIVLAAGFSCPPSSANAQQPAAPGANPAAQPSPGTQPAPSPQPAGKAMIYVYRPGSMVGATNHPRLFVNDDFLADLHNSEYASREVPSGTVVLSFLSKSTVDLTVPQVLVNTLPKKPSELLRIEVEPGMSYYFKWSYGGLHPLKQVDKKTGAKEVGKLHPAKD